MSTDIARRPAAGGALQIAAPSMPAVQRHRGALSLASKGTICDLPPAGEIEEACRELTTAIEARAPQGYAARAVGTLVLSYPQHRGPQEPAVYIAALASAAADYPPDVIEQACKGILRESKFLPSVAEFIQAAEVVQEERARLLHGGRKLLAAISARDAQRAVKDEMRRRRAEEQASIEAKIRLSFGEAVPPWMTIAAAWIGLRFVSLPEPRSQASYLLDWNAASGDAVAFVQLRRAALYGAAISRARPAPPALASLAEGAVQAIAGLLARGDDAAAAMILERPPGDVPMQDAAEAGPRDMAARWMRAALDPDRARLAAIAEGLIEADATPAESGSITRQER